MTHSSTNSAHFLAGSPYLTPDALTRTLSALVAINSVNPGYGGPAGGERAVTEWVATFLRGLGLEPHLRGMSPERPNLHVRLEGESSAPPILFETHIDTVSIAGMSIDPFAARIEGGRLWGRGATDAKASATAMLHALAAWATGGRRPPRAVELVLVSDEEFGFGGARALLAEGLGAGGIVIGEPTELRVVTTHKGTIRWWVRVAGKSAHAAKPYLGVNAIAHAAALVEEIEGPYAAELRERQAPLLEPPTINVGMIQGGVQVNLVPPECRIYLDRRIVPGETAEQVGRELEALFEHVRRRRPDFRAELEPVTLVAPPMATDPQCPLARAASAAAASQGLPPEPAGVDYATDASVLAASGLPIVILGPGSIDQAHTAGEYLNLEQLHAGARLFTELIGRLPPA